jgi:hypothetical protein
MESIAGLGIIIMVLAILAVAVLLIFAPLMLYGIFSRQGETNALLRYLADQSCQAPAPSTSKADHFTRTGEMLLPSHPDDSAPTFRTLR